MVGTQNSTLHRHKAQCEDEQRALLSALFLWTEPDRIFPQNYTETPPENRTKEKHTVKVNQNMRETKTDKRKKEKNKYIARRRFMNVPENVGIYNIQASIFSFLYKISPHLHQNHFHQTTK